jgi:hypothetical protein
MSILRKIRAPDRAIDMRRTAPLTRSELPGIENDTLPNTRAAERHTVKVA